MGLLQCQVSQQKQTRSPAQRLLMATCGRMSVQTGRSVHPSAGSWAGENQQPACIACAMSSTRACRSAFPRTMPWHMFGVQTRSQQLGNSVFHKKMLFMWCRTLNVWLQIPEQA